MHKATATSAIDYAQANKLDEWVHDFLLGEGNNKELSESIKRHGRKFFAPKRMKLDLFRRCFGPQAVDDDRDFFDKVNEIADRFKAGAWDMPPLIALECNKGYYDLDDGSHRFEALKMLGIDEYWVILWGSEA